MSHLPSPALAAAAGGSLLTAVLLLSCGHTPDDTCFSLATLSDGQAAAAMGPCTPGLAGMEVEGTLQLSGQPITTTWSYDDRGRLIGIDSTLSGVETNLSVSYDDDGTVEVESLSAGSPETPVTYLFTIAERS